MQHTSNTTRLVVFLFCFFSCASWFGCPTTPPTTEATTEQPQTESKSEPISADTSNQPDSSSPESKTEASQPDTAPPEPQTRPEPTTLPEPTPTESSKKTCTFNADCPASERCECDEEKGCFCMIGTRGTGKNGIDSCKNGNDCETALCIEDNDSGFTCSGPCESDNDCTGKLPICAAITFLGKVCIRKKE